MTSFCSERTIEYLLVPHLVNVLSKHFSKVIPIYSYATREFTKLSKSLHKNESFHAIALFPRRPKLTNYGSVGISTGNRLEQFQQITELRGIPVILGTVNASDFWGLDNSDNCIFLNKKCLRDDDHIIPLETIFRYYPEAIYTEEKLIDLAITASEITIESLSVIASEGRQALGHNGLYGLRYRPIYLLYK
ncbi:hypothetical protein C1O24_13365 [Vibrio diazotrophicus]|nr:hypothetical protein C1O24_13365 [Vibrio diazotrophicus]